MTLIIMSYVQQLRDLVLQTKSWKHAKCVAYYYFQAENNFKIQLV